jgi:hypothetical protein
VGFAPISPGTAFHMNIANDSIEDALTNVRNKLTGGKSNLTDFQPVQRVRDDVSDMAQSAAQSGHWNKAKLLRGRTASTRSIVGECK